MNSFIALGLIKTAIVFAHHQAPPQTMENFEIERVPAKASMPTL